MRITPSPTVGLDCWAQPLDAAGAPGRIRPRHHDDGVACITDRARQSPDDHIPAVYAIDRGQKRRGFVPDGADQCANQLDVHRLLWRRSTGGRANSGGRNVDLVNVDGAWPGDGVQDRVGNVLCSQHSAGAGNSVRVLASRSSQSAVSTAAGETSVARTPDPFNSARSTSWRPRMPNLLAAYAALPGNATWSAIEPTVTRWPRPLTRIPGTNARIS